MNAPSTDVSGLRALTEQLLSKAESLAEGLTADEVVDRNKQTLKRLQARLCKGSYENCYERLVPLMKVGFAQELNQHIMFIGFANGKRVWVLPSFGLITHLREGKSIQPLAGIPIPLEYPQKSEDFKYLVALRKIFGMTIKAHFLVGPILAIVQYRMLRFGFLRSDVGPLPEPNYADLTAAFDVLKQGKGLEIQTPSTLALAQLGVEDRVSPHAASAVFAKLLDEVTPPRTTASTTAEGRENEHVEERLDELAGDRNFAWRECNAGGQQGRPDQSSATDTTASRSEAQSFYALDPEMGATDTFDSANSTAQNPPRYNARVRHRITESKAQDEVPAVGNKRRSSQCIVVDITKMAGSPDGSVCEVDESPVAEESPENDQTPAFSSSIGGIIKAVVPWTDLDRHIAGQSLTAGSSQERHLNLKSAFDLQYHLTFDADANANIFKASHDRRGRDSSEDTLNRLKDVTGGDNNRGEPTPALNILEDAEVHITSQELSQISFNDAVLSSAESKDLAMDDEGDMDPPTDEKLTARSPGRDYHTLQNMSGHEYPGFYAVGYEDEISHIQSIRNAVGADRLSALPGLDAIIFEEKTAPGEYLSVILRVGICLDATKGKLELWAYVKPNDEPGEDPSVELWPFDDKQVAYNNIAILESNKTSWKELFEDATFMAPFSSLSDNQEFQAVIKYYFVLAADAHLFGFKNHQIPLSIGFQAHLIAACNTIAEMLTSQTRKKSTRGVARLSCRKRVTNTSSSDSENKEPSTMDQPKRVRKKSKSNARSSVLGNQALLPNNYKAELHSDQTPLRSFPTASAVGELDCGRSGDGSLFVESSKVKLGLQASDDTPLVHSYPTPMRPSPTPRISGNGSFTRFPNARGGARSTPSHRPTPTSTFPTRSSVKGRSRKVSGTSKQPPLRHAQVSATDRNSLVSAASIEAPDSDMELEGVSTVSELKRHSLLAAALKQAGLASALPATGNKLDGLDVKSRQFGDEIARGIEDAQIFEAQRRQACGKVLEAIEDAKYDCAVQWLDRTGTLGRDIEDKLGQVRKAAEEKRVLDEKLSKRTTTKHYG